jgi:SAM-dependent methyltransferase
LKTRGCIDRPQPGSLLKRSGSLELSGWGFFTGRPARLVEVRLDGVLWHVQRFNAPRPDVIRAYPEASKFGDLVGFSFTLEWFPEISEGTHHVSVFLVDAQGRRAQAAAVDVRVIADPNPARAAFPARAPLPAWPQPELDPAGSDFLAAKAEKLRRIRPRLTANRPFQETGLHYDFLTPELKKEFGITETERVSSHDYDEFALALLGKHKHGLVLDCGAGKRSVYYDQVVNFEIVPYPTTDVVGVGEKLPFLDNTFDAVFSLNVLEHVKDPFGCAREIARVMKPGADLYCVAAFLQPLHGYPHHYYNMSQAGLRNLFEKYLKVEKQEIITSGSPIWSLTWMVSQWATSLPETAKREFLNLKLADLTGPALSFLGRDFVRQLPPETVRVLASTTALFASKTHAASSEENL